MLLCENVVMSLKYNSPVSVSYSGFFNVKHYYTFVLLYTFCVFQERHNVSRISSHKPNVHHDHHLHSTELFDSW